ncbi:MAG: TraR/DksA C4-type zinc finger protein [Candidatus Lindowbacteria bacterium]|nr:TraR/DksA C4-type zinc finger protein [Candidatus Lindowbacteria bacterium]
MSIQALLPSFEEAAQFHGHVCPGLAIGYRVGTTAMQLLEVERPRDEELVAVIENDTCAADAIQVVTSCTFGKGNLIFKDYGKGSFSFFSRDKRKGIRVRYRDFPSLSGNDGARMEELKAKIHFERCASEAERAEYTGLRQRLIQKILTCKAEEILDWQPLTEEPPAPARIRPSIVCARCGEQVMETRVRYVNGKSLCIPCADK